MTPVDSILSAIGSMVALALITALGYVAARFRYITEDSRAGLSKLILNITLPCMIVSSVAGVGDSMTTSDLVAMLGLGATFYFVMLLAGAICNVVLRVPKSQRRVYLFMSTFTNTGFIGFAVLSSIFGSQTIFLGSIVIAVFNLFFYSMGIALLNSGGTGEKATVKSVLKSTLNMPLAASVAAITLFLTGLQLPAFLQTTVSMVGGITAPLAMMLVGLSLASSNIREMLRDWRLYAFSFLRFLALPLIAFLVLRSFVANTAIIDVYVVLLAMPVASMAPALASAYGHDDRLPTRGTVITTICSFATVPVLVALMGIV